MEMFAYSFMTKIVVVTGIDSQYAARLKNGLFAELNRRMDEGIDNIKYTLLDSNIEKYDVIEKNKDFHALKGTYIFIIDNYCVGMDEVTRVYLQR